MAVIKFDDLKKNISLPDFLHDHYGWVYERGSSRSNPKMRSPDGDVIVIRRNAKGYYTYFDVHDDRVKGMTILDFMQKVMAKGDGVPTLRKVGEVLQKYIEEGKTVLPEQSVYSVQNELLDADMVLNAVRHLKSLGQTKNFAFLKERGIDMDSLIRSITWGNVFWENMVKDDETGIIYRNTCVKLVNRDGVQGFSQRNSDFKGIQGGKFDSVANSGFDKKRPLDRLYIGESIIDCISYDQMYHYSEDKGRSVSSLRRRDDGNNLYLSSEGSFTEGQLTTVNEIVRMYRPAKVISLFDNDRAGQVYALKLLGGLIPEESAFSYKVSVVKKENLVYIQLRVEDNDKSLVDVRKLFPADITVECFEEESFRMLKTGGNSYEVSFPYVKEVLSNYVRHIGQIRLGERFELKLAKNSDFNDDLKEQLTVQKKENNNSLAI